MRKKMTANLTKNEFNLICDLYNGGNFFYLENYGWRHNLFCYDEISELKLKWKVNSNNLIKKLEALSTLETLELLQEIVRFWKIDDSFFQMYNSISPTEKINEILSSSDRGKKVEWMCTEPVKDFYLICQEMNMDYIIYSQDTSGVYKEVWGVESEHLLDFLLSLSSQHQFSSIQKLSDAILNGFKA